MTPANCIIFRPAVPGIPEHGHRFDSSARLIDPYAEALAGEFQKGSDGVIRPPKCVVVEDDFDWDGDRHIRRDISESIIYEMHVKGFTKSRTAKVKAPGGYLGVIEKIPYLQSLGITAVELMPVNEFPIKDIHGNKMDRPNYWGYDPMAFFSPHRGYAHDRTPGAQVREFKEMVKATPCRRYRSHLGRCLQSHLRRQRTWPDFVLQRTREPSLLHP